MSVKLDIFNAYAPTPYSCLRLRDCLIVMALTLARGVRLLSGLGIVGLLFFLNLG